MKIAMISQPMNGLTKEQIMETKQLALAELKGYDVIDTYFKDFDVNYPNANKGIMYIAKSIEAMASADILYMCDGWEEAQGCVFEHDIAKHYGLQIVYQGELNQQKSRFADIEFDYDLLKESGALDSLIQTFESFVDYEEEKKRFLQSGGTIFPEGKPRNFNELNKYEQDIVIGHLNVMTAPISGVFEGDSDEERFGTELLNEVSLDMSR